MTALLECELLAQERCSSRRRDELQELVYAAERAAHLSASVEDLLSGLAAVQTQVHGCRKAVVAEARSVGFGEHEIAQMLRLNVADFVSRFPVA